MTQSRSQALPDELDGVAGGAQGERAAQSEQHGQGGCRRVQRPGQGAHLRLPEDAQRRDRRALRRRSRRSSKAAARWSRRPARSGRPPSPTSASCSTTRASTPFHRDAQLPSHAADDLGRPGRQGRPTSRSLSRTTCSKRSRSSPPRGSTTASCSTAPALSSGVHEAQEADRRKASSATSTWRAASASNGATPSAARKEEPVPAGVAYDLWTGPAPAQAVHAQPLPLQLALEWDYGNGDLGNQGIHQMDSARWGSGVKYPTQDQLDGRPLHVR